jgi:hypothetical protein
MSEWLPATPTPDGYLRVSDRTGVRLVRKDSNTPMLPAMPQMLSEEPVEAAYSAAALKAMMTAHSQDNAQVQAIGGAIRTVTVGAGLGLASTMAWAVGYLLLPAHVRLEHLPLAWLGALLITLAYAMATEIAGRRYSSAGVELEKIRTAERMHRDRLEARQQMHADAVAAWQEVLTQALDKWERMP